MNKIINSISHYHMIQEDMNIIESIIQQRIKYYFSMIDESVELPFKDRSDHEDPYSLLLQKYKLSNEERLVFLLALSVEICPQILDPFLSKNKHYDTPFTEFGGVKNDDTKGFIPSIKTALFILCGNDYTLTQEYLKIFNKRSTLLKENILIDTTFTNSESFVASKIVLSKKSFYELYEDSEKTYDYGREFPASLLETNFEWSDLVFSKHTKEHLEELEIWLKYNDKLLNEWEMSKSLKEGYKALFYGPPGTGKSLTASLLGKKIGKKVYRIDLSSVISKYIGETEKNLEKIFLKAEEQDWILFFDEADSLFGKRTQVKSSNDRYANQGTSYLLQRIDESKNMIILASNLKDNFDEAYLRRFQSIVYFPLPEKEERLLLWKKGFSKKASLKNVNLEEIAHEYEVSGAMIMNVVRYASLMAIQSNTQEISESHIIKGIKREKLKEGKII